jgi:septum formation protein
VVPLVLASASPRRRELLERVGVAIEVRPTAVDEEPLAGELPLAYVARIARAKAAAVTREVGGWVLAADTTVTIDDAILGKAVTPDEAAAMLRRLSGRVHQVITAFSLHGDLDGRPQFSAHAVSTDVEMIALDDATIAAYVATGEWRGKAGAYAVQGIGAALGREVRGSITNVIGLPLVEVLAALRAVGAPSARFEHGSAQ